MKTTVWIPDYIFEEAEKMAREYEMSRSRLYSLALSEYLARRSPDWITKAWNQVLAEVGHEVDPFVEAAADEILRSVEWDE